MNSVILMLATVAIGVPEMIIFLLAALLLGFSIHFFWSGRKSASTFQKGIPYDQTGISQEDEWRLSFYEQIERHEKTQERLEKEIARMNESEKMLLKELNELRDEAERTQEAPKKQAPQAAGFNSASELLMAQQNLNELLSKEMNERLERAYEEFNFLQEKIVKIESQVIDPHHRNLEHEELEESYLRITKEYGEMKVRHLNLMEENQRLLRMLADLEEKVRDANFHKIQLSKKVVFLEELANDLQQVSGHHKKLEGQLKRISEIESLLARTASEGKR